MLKQLLIVFLLMLGLPSFTYAQSNLSNSEKEQVIPEIDNYFKRISFDDVDGVKKSLLNKDLSPNTLSKYGEAALPFAIREDAYKVFKYLLQVNDIDIEMQNKSTENALMWLAFKGNLELVKLMVEKYGAEVEKEGWSPIHYAATKGHLPVVQFLLSKDADVDAGSPNNTTALMFAARYGFINLVKFLLEHDADLSIHNDQNLTAIDFALMSNQKEISDGLKSRWKKLYGTDYVAKPRIFPPK
jgi:ankyrin repeat protein